jgi:hypothetical protein
VSAVIRARISAGAGGATDCSTIAPRRSVASAATGTLFLAANLGGAALGSHHQTAYVLSLTAGVVLAWAWLTALSAHRYGVINGVRGRGR